MFSVELNEHAQGRFAIPRKLRLISLKLKAIKHKRKRKNKLTSNAANPKEFDFKFFYLRSRHKQDWA
jgi:hypothetical protein